MLFFFKENSGSQRHLLEAVKCRPASACVLEDESGLLFSKLVSGPGRLLEMAVKRMGVELAKTICEF